MHRTIVVGLLALSYFSGYWSSPESSAEHRKANLTAKSDRVFGQRYTAPAGKPKRFYDEQQETGPPDEVIYWHGAEYVVSVTFAADGSVAHLQLVPEGLLYSDNLSAVSEDIELPRQDMDWFTEAAKQIQPLGELRQAMEAPGCFQSGRNLYCTDAYEFAAVSHYHNERPEMKPPKIALRVISIIYKQHVIGVVEDVKMEGSQRELRIGGQWYHGEKPGGPLFSTAEKGSLVSITSYGCTSNQKACLATAEVSMPK